MKKSSFANRRIYGARSAISVLLGAALAAAAIISLPACTKKASNEILIGEFGSMTGGQATFGQSTNAGIRLAIDEANERGGLHGKKIRLITRDTEGKAEQAVSVVKRLIEQDKVIAILGEVASTLSLAAAPIAQQAKIPMLTPSSTNPKVTEVGDFIFRTCFIDPFQGTVMAKFASENLKAKRVAILRDVKSDYSVGLANFFTQQFQQMGGTIAKDMTYSAGDIDFKAQLVEIKSSNADAIFIPGYYTEVGLIAKQARETGIKVPLLGGDGWDSPELSTIGGASVDGSYFSNHYSNESTDPVAVDFTKRFQAKTNKAPDGLSAAGYDAARVLLKAIENSPDLSPKSIRDQLARIADFPGVTGRITINEQRNAVKSAVVVQVKGKSNSYVTTINP